MENTVINTEKKKNSLQSKTGIFSKFLATLKERVSLLFIILVFIHICIVMTQHPILPIKLRALAGVIEFGLSAFLSYRFGYLGMLLSILLMELLLSVCLSYQMKSLLLSQITGWIYLKI
jgi:hypothetical protein